MINMLDIKELHQELENELESAIIDVVRSGRYIDGPNVKAFEEEIQNFFGVRHAVGVASGTSALRLAVVALKEMSKHDGGEVITTPYTFVATVEAIVDAGYTPKFVDVEFSTFLIDPKLVEQAITPQTRGLLPVHLFGLPCDMKALLSIARRYSLWVVEDAAQSFGARFGQQYTATLGDAGCLSFFPSKNLGGLGDGGMVVCDDTQLYSLVRSLHHHGRGKTKYDYDRRGGNYRLDEIQAAALRVKFRYLSKWNRQRDALAKFYKASFMESGLLDRGLIKVTPELPDRTHSYNQFVVKAEKRDELAEYLRDNGVACAIYYPKPLHLQKAYSFLGYKPGSLPMSERLSRLALALPLYPTLTRDKVSYIVDTIAAFYRL